MSQLPQQPWNEGDKFTNDATGVEYTFDGVKWLASGGEELDPLQFVSKTGGDEMEGPLTVYDKGIQVIIRNPNEVDINHPDYHEYSRYPLRVKGPSNYNRFGIRVDDGRGPYSLDENGAPFQGSSPPYLATIGLLQDKAVKAYPREVVSMGGLTLTVVGSINDTDDCLYTEAKIQSDYSKIVLNHDPVDNGPRVDWLARFPGDSTMFIQQGDQVFTLETTAVGAAGGNSRAKHFNIRSHDIPDAGLSDGRIYVGETANEANEPYLVSQEEFQSSSSHLQSEIEQIALGLETLLTQRTHGKWKYVGFSGDNIPRNAGEFSLASDDLSAQDNIITINLTDLNGTTIGLSDVEVGDYIEIVDDDEPANYALFTCTKAPEGTGISNIEVALKDKGNNFLVGDTCEIRFFAINQENIDLSELDDRYLKLSGGTMNAGKAIFVDQIEPVDNTRYIRYEAGRDKRYPFALANCGMVQDVAEEIFAAEIAKLPASGSVGRRFTFGWSATPSAGFFSFNGQQVVFAHADLNGVIRKHTDTDFTWDNFARMTIWNMEGELCYASELSKSTDYSSTVMRFYRESIKLDRVLEAGKDYDITIEGYW